ARPPRAAARPLRSLRPPAPERGGGEHAEPAVAGPHDLHGGDRRRGAVGPRADRDRGSAGRRIGGPALVRPSAGARRPRPGALLKWRVAAWLKHFARRASRLCRPAPGRLPAMDARAAPALADQEIARLKSYDFPDTRGHFGPYGG